MHIRVHTWHPGAHTLLSPHPPRSKRKDSEPRTKCLLNNADLAPHHPKDPVEMRRINFQTPGTRPCPVQGQRQREGTPLPVTLPCPAQPCPLRLDPSFPTVRGARGLEPPWVGAACSPARLLKGCT